MATTGTSLPIPLFPLPLFPLNAVPLCLALKFFHDPFNHFKKKHGSVARRFHNGHDPCGTAGVWNVLK